MTEVSYFVPCLVEEFLPEAAEAAIHVLTRQGVEVDLPAGQTCCGQPVYKGGHAAEARRAALHFMDVFEESPLVVSISASCVAMVRRYPDLFHGMPRERYRAERLAARTFEFTEFLVNKLGVEDVGAGWNARAAYHESCQTARAMGLVEEPRKLLANVEGLSIVDAARGECCGFGGPFSAAHPEISASILDSKLDAVVETEPDIVVTTEPSCMLHIRSGLEHRGIKTPVLHIAQILEATR